MPTSKLAIVQGVARALQELGASDESVCLVDADGGLGRDFARYFSERDFSTSAPLPSLVAVASGLAQLRRTAFVLTSASGLEGAWGEVARAARGGAAVKILSFEEGEVGLRIALAIPDLTVVAPSDAMEAYLAVKATAKRPGTCYVSLTPGEHRVLFGAAHRFEIGRNPVLREGDDASVIAQGMAVGFAVEAADELVKLGMRPAVISASCLRPFQLPVLGQGPIFALEAPGHHGLLASLIRSATGRDTLTFEVDPDGTAEAVVKFLQHHLTNSGDEAEF